MRQDPPDRSRSFLDCYEAMWDRGGSDPDVFDFLAENQQATDSERAEVLLFDLRRRRELGRPIPLEDYFERIPDLAREHKIDMIECEFGLEENAEVDDFVDRFPDLGEELRRRLPQRRHHRPETSETLELPGSDPVRADDLYSTDEWVKAVGVEGTNDDSVNKNAKGAIVAFDGAVMPERVGKYPIKKLLAVTYFKEVYLAHHEGLTLDVVVKLARSDFDFILEEAQIIARLDHPGIVKIYDAHRNPDGRGFLVERWIDGSDLSHRIETNRPSPRESAKLVRLVAEALHYVHAQGVVHRDIKPANILIDRNGRPIVTDFGLALRIEDYGKEEKQGGTIAYMSPEQARGEGHLVDGRTDIYSLGVVLYELLTGEIPFQGDTVSDIVDQIRRAELRPPRQIKAVPRELERICLRAAAKRISDRYSTALDLAEDLRHFVIGEAGTGKVRTSLPVGDAAGDRPAVAPPPTGSVRVVPKGLRSYEAEDADFFLELVPGPRDRRGLPESIRFWKSRIEETDLDRTFRVGVMYGPSGCGKSSLVKAGLLPRLDPRIETVFLEATPENTEARLLGRLQRQLSISDAELSLARTFAALRQGRFLAPEGKVLVVIDQLEQWLHGLQGEVSPDVSELTEALRHCDGERLQCLVLVRDDFWMATSQFMAALEIPLEEGRNCAAVHLFNRRHARKVLAVFGHAHGILPEPAEELALDHARFLDRAVDGLAEDGCVIPVRLALLAQLMRGREWSPRTLRDLGGTLGIGVAFFEETFESPRASPGCRAHRKAAMSVLQVLLPPPGTDIKGVTRSGHELLESSGYAQRPGEFEQLLTILDREVRILTPVDPSPLGAAEREAATEKHYQLTHDYVVPPLREWLTRAERRTATGRARLLLRERASLWSARPERKQLPSAWEWLKIRLRVRRNRWTAVERRMMRAAGRLHVRRGLAVLVLAVIGISAVLEQIRSPLKSLLERYGRDQTVGSWVETATMAWQAGREKEALAMLAKAHRERRDHPAVQRFLSEASTEGGVTFDKAPGDVEFEVKPDQEADGKLGLAWEPRVISAGTRFRSGEHIRLAVGPYRVRVLRRSGEFVTGFPLLIGQVRYDDLSGNPRWLPPGTTAQGFTFAEQLVLPIKLPDDIPSRMIFVNEGPMWRGPDPMSISARSKREIMVEGVAVEIYDGSGDLVRDVVPHGFLIAEAETTRGDFKRWWSRLGQRYCDWHVAIDTRIPEARAETAVVPLEVHRECWRDELEKKGIDPAALNRPSEVFDAVLADLHARWNGIWTGLRDATAKNLSEALHDELPVAVGREAAIAYARTHAPIELTEFHRWVERMIRDAGGYVAKLEESQSTIEQQTGEFVEPATLSQTPMVRFLRGPLETDERPRAILDAYVWWLKVRTYYGWQLPIERVRAWGLNEATWLWRRPVEGLGIRNPNSVPRARVDNYASDLEDGKESPLRSHLLRWLHWMVDQEEEERRTYEKLLERLDGSDAAKTLETLPFAIRYRYGVHLGWDIPTWKQWEKAYRGTDARRYAWGNGERQLNAWLQRSSSEQPLSAAGATSTVADVSPYNLLHMAGNLSEWVRLDDASNPSVLKQFLKGGNLVMEATIANGGYTLAVQGGQVTRWTGFRVVREIRP